MERIIYKGCEGYFITTTEYDDMECVTPQELHGLRKAFSLYKVKRAKENRVDSKYNLLSQRSTSYRTEDGTRFTAVRTEFSSPYVVHELEYDDAVELICVDLERVLGFNNVPEVQRGIRSSIIDNCAKQAYRYALGGENANTFFAIDVWKNGRAGIYEFALMGTGVFSTIEFLEKINSL